MSRADLLALLVALMIPLIPVAILVIGTGRG